MISTNSRMRFTRYYQKKNSILLFVAKGKRQWAQEERLIVLTGLEYN
ncbi:hypothetical protein PP707_04845 [Acetobacter pasteurianus]|nr:hypothetical protein [Acetobacter pasteurianus]